MMMKTLSPEENLAARAELFKALGHPARLLILNLIKLKPRHGEELALILGLQPATISHHLTMLATVGLLQSQKDQYYQTYSLVDNLLDKTLGEIVHMPQEGVKAQVSEDAYQQKVLRSFIKHGRLTHLPAQLKKCRVILAHIVQEFEPNRTYTEQEVNRILLEFHEDVALLRRELVDEGFMTRDAGIYRRLAENETALGG